MSDSGITPKRGLSPSPHHSVKYETILQMEKWLGVRAGKVGITGLACQPRDSRRVPLPICLPATLRPGPQQPQGRPIPSAWSTLPSLPSGLCPKLPHLKGLPSMLLSGDIMVIGPTQGLLFSLRFVALITTRPISVCLSVLHPTT